VLVPLRLDRFGAGAVAIGAAFLVAVVFESAVSPLAGRWPTGAALHPGALRPGRERCRDGAAAGGDRRRSRWRSGWSSRARARDAVDAGHGRAVRRRRGARRRSGLRVRPRQSRLGPRVRHRRLGGGALAEATTDAVPFLVVGVVSVLTAFALHEKRTTLVDA